MNIAVPSDVFDRPLFAGSVKRAFAGTKSRDLWQIEPQKLRVMAGFNARVGTADLSAYIRNLADSMKANGFYMDKPLSVYIGQEDGEDVPYVVDGHCRLEAVLLAISEGAPIVKVPCVTEDRSTTLEDLTVKLFRSNTGRHLTPFETGIVCKRLIGYGWAQPEIADRLGIAGKYVEGLLMLVGAPRQIRDAVIADAISASEAVKVLRRHGDKAVAELEAMLAKAQGEGRARVTARHATGAAFRKAIKKHGESLYVAAKSVQSDPGFAALSEETRQVLADLLVQLGAAEDSPAQVNQQ